MDWLIRGFWLVGRWGLRFPMLEDLTNAMALLYWIDRRNRGFSGGVFLSFPVFAAEATHYQKEGDFSQD